MAIRTEDFYRIYHAVWERYDQREAYGYMGGNTLIPLHDTITDHGWELSSNYLYQFRVSGIDPETGLPVERYMAVGSERQLTPNEAAAALSGLLVGQEAFYGLAEPSFSLSGAYARPGGW